MLRASPPVVCLGAARDDDATSAAATRAVATRMGKARIERMVRLSRSTAAPFPLNRRPSACWKTRFGCEILVCAVAHVAFRILGRLEATVDGRRVELSSRRQRALLGVLLLHVGDVVSVDALIDSVWGE